MNLDYDFFSIDQSFAIPSKGRILISEPFIQDIYFKRSIVLLTEHTEDGTVGFVLNKPISLNINDVVKDFPNQSLKVSLGGPVNTNTIHFIHSLGDLIPNSVPVKDELYWGGDFDVVKKLVAAEKISMNQIKFFLGYSGWSPGQLEDEINENSWLVVNMPSKDILNPPKNRFWKKVLESLDNKYSMWTNFPENPQYN